MEASGGGSDPPIHSEGARMALAYCHYHDEWYDEDEQEVCSACEYDGWLNEVVEVEDCRAEV